MRTFAQNFAFDMIHDALVSVIMPTHNGGKFLSDSIRSVLAQSYANLELLITDDHSTNQETIEILKRFEREDKREKLTLLTENHGPGYARNKSIEIAS